MENRTRRYVMRRFADYYRMASHEGSLSPSMPPDIKHREWGFIMFDDAPNIHMRRHKGYSTQLELEEYIQGMVPAHVYFSAAYYEYPSAPTMKEKLWKGADLIFDLDADHLPDVPNSYREMLENVKAETGKLITFLQDDFGFEDMNVVFSGGRGYHIHIHDERVLTLGSPERREIIDYLNAMALSPDNLIKTRAVGGDVGMEGADILTIQPEDSDGWGGKMNDWIIQKLSGIVEGEKPVKKLQTFEGIGKGTAQKIVNIFSDADQIETIRNGNLNALKSAPRMFWETLIEEAVNELGVHVDEPVTADVKRLIRMPGSLHGKSGMKVVPLTLSGFDDFDPLSDAIVFKNGDVEVNVIRPGVVEMMGESIDAEEGVQAMPEYAAMYLMCRGAAELK